MRYEWMVDSGGKTDRIRRRRVRRMIVASESAMAMAAPTIGNNTDITAMTTALNHSNVETMKFPNPPVVSVEEARVATEAV